MLAKTQTDNGTSTHALPVPLFLAGWQDRLKSTLGNEVSFSAIHGTLFVARIVRN